MGTPGLTSTDSTQNAARLSYGYPVIMNTTTPKLRKSSSKCPVNKSLTTRTWKRKNLTGYSKLTILGSLKGRQSVHLSIRLDLVPSRVHLHGRPRAERK